MQWSPQQSQALDAVGDWLTDRDQQVFRLFGFAGTGKTTLARHLGESHDGLVHYAAFTGKAALVLRRKGCPEASTIHGLLYTPSPKSRERLHELEAEFERLKPSDLIGSDGRIDFSKALRHGHDLNALNAASRAVVEERERLRQPAFSVRPDPLLTPRGRISLIVVDEVSMVDERLGRDLESTGVKILVLGDPAQLPPVAGGGYFTAREPDFLLTEVHRQALDSPVLALATQVREGRALVNGTWGESRVIERTALAPEEYAAAEQLLVGYNATRRGANRRLRQMAGRLGQLPEVGEKLVCLRNDHSPEKRLLNGSLWSVVRSDDRPTDATFDLSVRSLDEAVVAGDERQVDVRCHKYTFIGSAQPEWHDLQYCECSESGVDLPRCERGCRPARIAEFDFGSALTVHKAQGSQWDDVILIDEWTRSDRNRHLYTGITRAAKRITVAR